MGVGREDSQPARLVSEFVGTYLLVFTVGCNVLSGSPAWAATSIACVLTVSIYALGGVSGAHFNPAVSVTLGLSNKLPWSEVGIYCATQIVAGVTAGLSYGSLFFKVFNLEPQAEFGWFEAMLAEVLYSFMLCFVVLNVASARKNEGNQFFGIAIGFVIIAGGYAVGNVSGGAFNPAVALGIDISSLGVGVGWGFAYTIFELIGSAMAALAFRVVRPDDFGGSSNYSLGTKLASEFIGTFFLVLTVGLNVLGKSPGPVWSIAASLMCMVYALATCSGAHFNPAVTMAILASGRQLIEPIAAAYYMVVQISGGLCAAITVATIHHGASFAFGPAEGFSYAHAAMAEVTYTFLLCFVVLAVTTVSRPTNNGYSKQSAEIQDFSGLAIASCVTAGGYAVGAVSGGCLNPAVSFGICAMNWLDKNTLGMCLIYTSFEFIGAGLAAGVFMLTHSNEYKARIGV